jgi:hypothetical protein
MTELAIRMGGHARVGLEDNIFLDKGVLAEGSAPLVRRAADYAAQVGRKVADPARASVILSVALPELVDRSDQGAGDFDIIFNFDQIEWETGDASGGTDGLGGSSARAGYSNGTTTSLELPGSAVNGALLDTSPTGLVHNSRSSVVNGRYVFEVRGGTAPTGGTISGVGRYFKERKPEVLIVGVDPEGSVYTAKDEKDVHPYLVEGIGKDTWPKTMDPDVVDEWVRVSDRDSFLTARRLA